MRVRWKYSDGGYADLFLKSMTSVPPRDCAVIACVEGTGEAYADVLAELWLRNLLEASDLTMAESRAACLEQNKLPILSSVDKAVLRKMRELDPLYVGGMPGSATGFLRARGWKKALHVSHTEQAMLPLADAMRVIRGRIAIIETSTNIKGKAGKRRAFSHMVCYKDGCILDREPKLNRAGYQLVSQIWLKPLAG